MSLFRVIKHHFNHLEDFNNKIIARCKLGLVCLVAREMLPIFKSSVEGQISFKNRLWQDIEKIFFIFINSLRVLTALTDSSAYSWCWFFALPSKFRLVSSVVSLQTLETLPWSSVYGCTATLLELAPALGNSMLQWCDVTLVHMLGRSSSGNKSGK